MIPLNQPCRAEVTEALPPHEIGMKARECDMCLEYLNACRTLIGFSFVHDPESTPGEPRYILDKDHNQKSGVARCGPFVHEMNLQEHFVFLKRLEAITAEVSFLYTQKIIKERVSDPDIIKRKKDPAAFKAAVEAQKMAQRPVKERRQLDAREKAIEGLMKATGLPESVATQMVDEQLKKQGKVTA
jgi:hypothetical protein